MSISKDQALALLDAILDQYKLAIENGLDRFTMSKLMVRMQNAVNNLAPKDSAHALLMPDLDNLYVGDFEHAAGVIEALRDDYAADCLRTFEERVRTETYDDFLELAHQLLIEKRKDPAASVVGAVLEEHLRKLADKVGISLTDRKGQPKTLNPLNDELYKQKAYGKTDWSQLGAWAAVRNAAAHGHFSEYTDQQVRLMIEGIRSFFSRVPA